MVTDLLEPIPVIAQRVLGHPVCAQTALRWATSGRRGIRLPTQRGRWQRRVTTEAEFRRWLAATSGDELPPQEPDRTVADPRADAVLAQFGLQRREV